MRRPPRSPLFPYTTLFRSDLGEARERLDGERAIAARGRDDLRSEEHTSELQSRRDLVCRLLLEKKRLSSVVLAPGTALRRHLWSPGGGHRGQHRREPVRDLGGQAGMGEDVELVVSDRLNHTRGDVGGI